MLEQTKKSEPEVRTPIRTELHDSEKIQIRKDLLRVFAENNLSIGQCKDILNETIQGLDKITPWNYRFTSQS